MHDSLFVTSLIKPYLVVLF